MNVTLYGTDPSIFAIIFLGIKVIMLSLNRLAYV